MNEKSDMIQLFQDLSSVSVEAPSSLIHFVSRINSLLGDHSSQPLKKIYFMTYELKAKCTDLGEEERLHILNDYFFNQQGFKIIPTSSPELWNMSYVVKSKKGSPQIIAFIYIHLTASIDLPIYITQLQDFNVVKWVQGNQAKYIDLTDEGKLLSGKTILDILNENESIKNPKDDALLNTQMEIVPTKDLLLYYAQSLCNIYKSEGKEQEYKTMLDVCLILAPCDLNFLSQRALLLKQIGSHQKALMDLKKYFSFTPMSDSSEELKVAFYELNERTSQPHSPIGSHLKYSTTKGNSNSDEPPNPEP